MTKQKTSTLDLQEVSYTDLNDNEVKVKFDNKEFANTLYAQASSIEIDEVARSLHKTGKAKLTENVKEELIAIISQSYRHRVVEAIKSSIK